MAHRARKTRATYYKDSRREQKVGKGARLNRITERGMRRSPSAKTQIAARMHAFISRFLLPELWAPRQEG